MNSTMTIEVDKGVVLQVMCAAQRVVSLVRYLPIESDTAAAVERAVSAPMRHLCNS